MKKKQWAILAMLALTTSQGLYVHAEGSAEQRIAKLEQELEALKQQQLHYVGVNGTEMPPEQWERFYPGYDYPNAKEDRVPNRERYKPENYNQNIDGKGAATTSASQNYGSIAIGVDALAPSWWSTAIGMRSFADDRSMAIGVNSTARINSTAVGNSAYANAGGNAFGFNAISHGGVAIGHAARAGKGYKYREWEDSANYAGGVAIGRNSRTQSATSIGDESKTEPYGVAVGTFSSAELSGTALGSYSKAPANKGVAIGHNSLADRTAGYYAYDPMTGIAPKTDADMADVLGKRAEYDALMVQIEPHEAEFNALTQKMIDARVRANELKEIIRNTRYSTDLEEQKQYEAAQKEYDEGYKNRQVYNKANEERNEWLKSHTDFVTAYNKRIEMFKGLKSDLGAVSVGGAAEEGLGSGNNTRQIINVAGGLEDTDAVNLAQLKQLRSYVDKGASHFVSVNSGKTGDDEKKLNNYNNDGAKAAGTIAIGPNALSDVVNNIAIGRNSLSSGTGSLAVGSGARAGVMGESSLGVTAIGTNAFAGLQGAASLGSGAKATGLGSIAIGEDSETHSGSAVTVGHNSKTDLTSGVSVGGMINNYGRGAIAIGGFSKVSGGYSIAQGYNAFAGKYITKEEYEKLDDNQKTAWVKDEEFVLYQALGLDPSGEYYLNKDVNSATGAIAIGASSKTLDKGVSVGFGTKSGDLSVAIGNNSNAGLKQKGNTLIGADTVAGNNANNITAIGKGAIVATEGGVALGSDSLSIYGTGNGNNIGYSPIKGEKYSNTSEELLNTLGLADKKIEIEREIADLQTKIDDYNVKYEAATRDYKEAVSLLNRYQQEYEESDRDRGIIRTKLDTSTPEKLEEARQKIREADAKNSENDTKLKAQKKVVEQKKAEAQQALAQLGNVRREQQLLNGRKLALNKLTNTWQSTTGEVAIGNPNTGTTRQITGLAAGTRDTDAVNVAQLKQTVQLNKNLQAATGLTDDEIAKINNPDEPNKPKTLVERINELQAAAGNSGVQYFSVKSTDGKNVNNDGAKQTDGIAIGKDSENNGWETVTIGKGTTAGANSSYSVVVGSDSKSSGLGDVVIGSSAKSTGAQTSVVIGYGATSTAGQTQVLGLQAKATAANAIAIGSSSIASGEQATAVGPGAKGEESGTVAVGSLARVSSTAANGIAIGQNAYVGVDTKNPSSEKSQSRGMAIGSLSKAYGAQSAAFGAGAEAHNTNSLAVGAVAIAKGNTTIAMGHGAKTLADANYSQAIGYFASTQDINTVALGPRAHAAGVESIAIGYKARTVDKNSVAIGANSVAVFAQDGKAVFSEEEVKADSGTFSVGNPDITEHMADGTEKKIPASYRRVTNVAGGILSNDAVNVAQLKAAKTAVTGSGAAIVTETKDDNDKHAIYNVHVDKTVQFIKKQDGTPVTKVGGRFYTIKPDGTPNTDDEVVATEVVTSLVHTDGTSVNPMKLTNVADGTIGAGSKDAVNGSQLHTTNQNVETNTGNIATNTGNIATNTGNIATNTGNIATNTGNIATNTGNIATNTGNIATNTNNIATNTANIATLQRGWTLSDGNNSTGIVAQDTLTVRGDDYIQAVVTQDGDALTIQASQKLLQKIQDSSDAAQNFTVGADTNTTGNGINITKTNNHFDIKGVANGDITTSQDGNTIRIDLSEKAKEVQKDLDNQVQGNTNALGGGANYDKDTDTYTRPTYTMYAPTGPVETHTVGEALAHLDQGFKVTATTAPNTNGVVSGTSESVVRTNDLVTYSAGKNMAITQGGNSFTFGVVERPEFKGLNLKGDNGITTTMTPDGNGNVVITDGTDGENGQNGKTIIGKNGITVEGDKGTTKIEGGKVAVDGKDGKPGEIVILDGKPGKDGKVITLDSEGNLVVGEKGENGTDGITTIITKDNIGEVINGKDGKDGIVEDNDDLYENKTNEGGQVVNKDNKPIVKDETSGKWYPDNGQGKPDTAQPETKPARVLKGIRYVGNVKTGEYKKTLGEEVKIYGNDKVNTKDGYVATNVITENTKDGLQILFAEKPEFKGVSLNDGAGNSATITPSGTGNITVDDGNNGQNGKTTIGKDGISTNGKNGISVEGDKGTTKIEGGKVAVDGKDGKPGEIVILDGKPGKDGKVITLDSEGNLVVGEKGENGTDGITTIITKDNIGEVINGKDGKDGIVEDNDDLYENKTNEGGKVVNKDNTPIVKDETSGKWYPDNGQGKPDTAQPETKPARVLKGIRYVGDLNTAEYKKTLGEEVKIYGNDKVKVKDGYVATNVITENTKDGLQILFAEKPEFKGVSLNDGAGNSATITPSGTGNITVDDGNNGQNGKTTIGKDGISTNGQNGISVEGDKGTTKIEGGKVAVDGKDGKPGEIVILDGKPGKDGKVITLDNEGNLAVGPKGDKGADGITTIITKDNIGEVINGKDGKDGIVEDNDKLFEDKKDDDNDVVDANGNKLVKGDDDKWYKKGADGTADKAQGEQKPARVLKGISYVGDVNTAEYKKTLGEAVKIYGNDKVKVKDGYVATNVITETTEKGLQILFAEKPEFKGVSLKDGDNSATITPSGTGNITVDDGNNGKNGKTTIGKDGISIKGKDGADGQPGKTVSITVDKDGDAVVRKDGKDGKDGVTKIVTEENLKDILSGKTPGSDPNNKGIIADLINPITLEAEGNGVTAGDTNASKSFNPLDKNQKLNISAGEGLKWNIEEGKWTLNVDKDKLEEIVSGGTSEGVDNDNVQVDNKGVVVGKDGKDGEPGKDGSVVIGKDGKDGKGGTDGANGITITGPKGEDGTTQIVHVGKDGISGTNGKDGKDAKGFDLGTDGLTVINGKDGENGKSVYGADGMTITGPKGEDGKPGKTVIIKADQVDMGGNRIENVAPGEKATDAVNKGQLDEAISGVATEIGNVNGKLGRMQTESDRGDALNAALAALKPIQFNPYERSQIMAGVGLYKGKQAVALGVGHYSNESTFVHAGLSYAGSSDLMANLGVTWRFGTKEDRDYLAKRPERYADGPISSVYVLQDEMIALQQENQQIRNENQQIREENEKMKAQIERLLQAVGLQ